MSLARLQKIDPKALSTYRVDQIVALAGDGRLKDGSICSTEFREYLRSQSTQTMRRYIQETLTQSFTDSGFVLQDLVNEIGRRLGFTVEDGRYRGVVNRTGQDGVWKADQMNLVVEVKTTDAYRINLSTVASYAQVVKASLKNPDAPLGLLYVVGRQDTGDLEAQIRGSRYAWDVRLISAEALLDLADLVEVAVDEDTANALRSSLLPVEYTRIDHLVELLAKLAFDVERSVQVDQVLEEDTATTDGAPKRPERVAREGPELLSPDEFRGVVLKSIQKRLARPIVKVSRSVYQASPGQNYVVSVSKRYTRSDQSYWYALQSRWTEELSKDGSFLCLAMLDRDFYFQIPGKKAVEFTPLLNRTVKPNTSYWHIGLTEQSGKVLLNLPKAATLIDLMEFKVDL
jgi:hypothetical protein